VQDPYWCRVHLGCTIYCPSRLWRGNRCPSRLWRGTPGQKSARSCLQPSCQCLSQPGAANVSCVALGKSCRGA